jgi:integrase
MTPGQLSLLLGPAELEPVPWGPSRRLPLLRVVPSCETHSHAVAEPSGRRVSRVCQPGYHKGRKPGNAGNTYPPEPVTVKDVQRLLAATGHGYAGTRDRALYTFLWGTGARIAETLDLLPPEIDLEERTVTILRGKGGKRRTVGLSTQTIEELERWFDRRADLGLTDAHPVFPVISQPTVGKRLYASCVREQLRDCAKRAGIRKRITPHCFRHGMAVDLVRRGIPINVISKCLGHSNSAITARYIDHVDNEEALDAMRDRVWLVAA